MLEDGLGEFWYLRVHVVRQLERLHETILVGIGLAAQTRGYDIGEQAVLFVSFQRFLDRRSRRQNCRSNRARQHLHGRIVAHAARQHRGLNRITQLAGATSVEDDQLFR